MRDVSDATRPVRVQAKDEEEEAAARQQMLLGSGIAMLVITAGVVLFLRRRMALDGEMDEPAKDFSLPDMPSMNAQPAAAEPMETQSAYQPQQAYEAQQAYQPVAEPMATQAVDDSALGAFLESEPGVDSAPAVAPVAAASAVAAPVVDAAEPTVVNQWTDESGHTWRVMSDGSNRWWNGTDWQKV